MYIGQSASLPRTDGRPATWAVSMHTHVSWNMTPKAPRRCGRGQFSEVDRRNDGGGARGDAGYDAADEHEEDGGEARARALGAVSHVARHLRARRPQRRRAHTAAQRRYKQRTPTAEAVGERKRKQPRRAPRQR